MTRSFLLIHGMCCTGEVWRNFKRFYEAQGIRVFAPTLRPELRVRRRPPAALAALRFTDYVADLEHEIDRIEQLTSGPVTVIGHSMGGLLAQALAERNRPNAAVFISPTSPVGARSLTLRRFWKAFDYVHRAGLVPGALYPYRPLTEWIALNAVPAEERRTEHASMVCESRAVFADFRRMHIDESKIRIPVLTISAKRDRLVPAIEVRRTAQKYAAIGGHFKEYAEHGHWLYAEPGWEKPAKDILEWVETHT